MNTIKMRGLWIVHQISLCRYHGKAGSRMICHLTPILLCAHHFTDKLAVPFLISEDPSKRVMEKSESPNKVPRTEADIRDRISDLPDSLLLHILSFLPAKEAIATSVLSKRWRPLWPYLPTLELKRRDFKKFTFFHQFVDKLHKSADLKSVKKFVFKCECYKSREYFRPWKITEWINSVIINKVEHLDIHVFLYKKEYEYPSSIFTAKNIKVLKLKGGVIAANTLSQVNLSLLQVLHLEYVRFPDFKSLGILLSGCVLLRDLVLRSLGLDKRHPLDIGGLNHLVTALVPRTLIQWRVLTNVTFLRCCTQDSSTFRPGDIPTFYNLIYLEFECYPSVPWKTTLKLLESCPKLENLAIKMLCSQSLEITSDIPQCVSSKLKEFRLGNCCGRKSEFELARYIMKNAMVLRTMSLSKVSSVTWRNRILKKIPLCPISSANCRLLLK